MKLAWSRAGAVSTVQQQLDSAFAQLQLQVEADHCNVDSLVVAVALLCGTLYPLCLRAAELAAQRDLLATQLCHFDAFKQQVMSTFTVTNSTNSQTNENSLDTTKNILYLDVSTSTGCLKTSFLHPVLGTVSSGCAEKTVLRHVKFQQLSSKPIPIISSCSVIPFQSWCIFETQCTCMCVCVTRHYDGCFSVSKCLGY